MTNYPGLLQIHRRYGTLQHLQYGDPHELLDRKKALTRLEAPIQALQENGTVGH